MQRGCLYIKTPCPSYSWTVYFLRSKFRMVVSSNFLAGTIQQIISDDKSTPDGRAEQSPVTAPTSRVSVSVLTVSLWAGMDITHLFKRFLERVPTLADVRQSFVFHSPGHIVCLRQNPPNNHFGMGDERAVGIVAFGVLRTWVGVWLCLLLVTWSAVSRSPGLFSENFSLFSIKLNTRVSSPSSSVSPLVVVHGAEWQLLTVFHWVLSPWISY